MVSLTERQVISLIIPWAEKGVSQSQLGQVCSVINILSEVCGFVSPVQSPVVSKVKMAAIKEANFGKKKTVRKGMTLQLMKIIIDGCYKRNSWLVLPERRRFLIMQLFCFFGVRRFNDIQFVKRKNIVFGRDKSVKVWVEQSKTDARCEGFEFVLTSNKIGKVSIRKMLMWYFDSFDDMEDEAYIFPVFKKGLPVWTKAVSYGVARLQLMKERTSLGLGKVTWHSGRIGAATLASKNGVSRNVIKMAGRWKSDAVDTYIRVKEAGKIVGKALVE